MKNLLIVMLLLCSSFLYCQSSDPSDTKFVSPSYPNSDPFYSTITDAINSGRGPFFIEVYPGTYNESITMVNGINIHCWPGVTITSSGATIDFTSSSFYKVSFTGQAIIEGTGSGETINYTNTSGGTGSKINFECSEVNSPNGTGIYAYSTASNSYLNFSVGKIFSKQYAAFTNLGNISNVFELKCDSIYTLNQPLTSFSSVRTISGTNNFNINSLVGNGTILWHYNGVIDYKGINVKNMNDSGHAIKTDGSARFTGNIEKIFSDAYLHACVEIVGSSFMSLDVQDTIYGGAGMCVNSTTSTSFNINAGYIINNSTVAAGGQTWTLNLYSPGYLNAKEVKNLGDYVVFYGQPSNYLTLHAKFIGNNSTHGIITVDATDYLILDNCVIYNAYTSGFGVYTNNWATTRYVRIYGSLFTNVAKRSQISYLTGSETVDTDVR